MPTLPLDAIRDLSEVVYQAIFFPPTQGTLPLHPLGLMNKARVGGWGGTITVSK